MASCSLVAEGGMRTARSAVDEIVKLLHSFKEFNVAEVKESGSMGHGTVVPGNFDIDLVLYSRDIKAEEVLEYPAGYIKWLEQLEPFLKRKLGSIIRIVWRSKFLIHFEYDTQSAEGMIDVDLLVSPYWEEPADLYDFLCTVPKKSENCNFSTNVAKWQVGFIDIFKQPDQDKIKELTKRAKAWRNKMWPKKGEGSGCPRSYLLQLLVLRAYQRAKSKLGKRRRQQYFSQTTYELKQMVLNHQTLNIYWENKGVRTEYYYRRKDYKRLLPSRPRIIDPANPSNNVYITGIWSYQPKRGDPDTEDGDWTLLKRYIDTLDLSEKVENQLR